MLGKLAELNSLSQIPFDRLQATRQRILTDVAHHDRIARRRRDLRDAVTHCACAQHRDRLDRARRRRVVRVSVRVCAQRISRKTWPNLERWI